MKKSSPTLVTLIAVLLVYNCCTIRANHTLPTEDARLALSECPVCMAVKEEKGPFASFFSTFTNCFSFFRNGKLSWMSGEFNENVYNVNRDVLPVFVKASVQLTWLVDHFQQQAIAVDDSQGLPDVIPWIYRSSAANLQSLAYYLDLIVMELSSVGTTNIRSTTLKCHISSLMDFMFQNTFPNMITVLKIVTASKHAWLSDELETTTPTTFLESRLQRLYPSCDGFHCFADEEVVDSSVVLAFPQSGVHDRFLQFPTVGFYIIYFLVILPVIIGFFAVYALVYTIRTFFIDIPIAIIGAAIEFIRSLLDTTNSTLIRDVNGTDPTTEKADVWALLVEFFQASHLTSEFISRQERSGLEWQCETETLKCQFVALLQSVPTF